MNSRRAAYRTGFAVLAVAAGLVTGCRREVLKNDPAVFKNAPVEVKQLWADGEKAVAANDFGPARAAYVSLLRQPLTPEQAETVTAALTELRQRMDAAVVKGDSTARKAAERPNP
jgi:hypothetical protein